MLSTQKVKSKIMLHFSKTCSVINPMRKCLIKSQLFSLKIDQVTTTTMAISIVKIKEDKVLHSDAVQIKSSKSRESQQIRPQSLVKIFQAQSSRISTAVKMLDLQMARDSSCRGCKSQMKQLKEVRLRAISVNRCHLQLVSS